MQFGQNIEGKSAKNTLPLKIDCVFEGRKETASIEQVCSFNGFLLLFFYFSITYLVWYYIIESNLCCRKIQKNTLEKYLYKREPITTLFLNFNVWNKCKIFTWVTWSKYKKSSWSWRASQSLSKKNGLKF